LCPDHAETLGVDFVASPDRMQAFWDWLGLEPAGQGPPLWEAYPHCRVGVMTLSRGCPNRCPYCASRRISGPYTPRETQACLEELVYLAACGVRDVAFYDDALLVRSEEVLLPFLEGVRKLEMALRFHTPNALHSRLLSVQVAREMVSAGFETFFLGSESLDVPDRSAPVGVCLKALKSAAANLRQAGVDSRRIVAYMIVGHPRTPYASLVSQLDAIAELGIRIMPAEFSPIPGTPDAATCARHVDLGEPLGHNKTAWSIRFLGPQRLQHLKDRARRHNRGVKPSGARKGRT
jgi:radical SAM superfamily enzyme YgiQ (UPF0313 family)